MESIPKTESFALYQEKASSMKQADPMDMFKSGLQECLYIDRGIS
jgi:hypothetical protein